MPLKSFMHRGFVRAILLKMLRDEGCAILLLSGDVEELRQMADRILVFFRGTISLGNWLRTRRHPSAWAC